jgi:hypothetical protein
MTKKTPKLSNYEASRWMALLKAIDVVEENCHVLKKNFDEIELKPVALKHYINSMATKIQNDLDKEDARNEKKFDLRSQVVERVAKLIPTPSHGA